MSWKGIHQSFDNWVDHLVGETEAKTRMGQQAGPHFSPDYLVMYTSILYLSLTYVTTQKMGVGAVTGLSCSSQCDTQWTSRFMFSISCLLH